MTDTTANSPSGREGQTSEFPAYSEDVSDVLQALCAEHDTEVIRSRLFQIIVYIRTEKKSLRSRVTSEGDNAVAQIEHSLAAFLDSCHSKDFQAIYPHLRELVEVVPKLDALGIDIAELRDYVAEYHEQHLPNSAFYSVAEVVREAVHRRLSAQVIGVVDELVGFLESDRKSALVADRYCSATQEEKEREIASQAFQKLLDLRDKLRLIWNDPFSRDLVQQGSSQCHAEVDQFVSSAALLLKRLLEPCRDWMLSQDARGEFLPRIDKTIQAIEERRLDDIHLGLVRYHLKNSIAEVATGRQEGRGRLALRLMTLDCVLENLSLVYYSNVVNVDLATVSDSNYRKGVEILPDLALCARAMGHGTKTVGRVALLLSTRVDRGEVDPAEIESSVREMNEEMLRSIFDLRQSLLDLLTSSPWHVRYADIERLHTKLLNDTVREKTTHLFGNLLNSMMAYLGAFGQTVAADLEWGERREWEAQAENGVQVADLFFRFGLDATTDRTAEENVWHMGGKGASQAEMSRLIAEYGLEGVDVPKGFGLSTRTWPQIRHHQKKREVVVLRLREEVKGLEERTGKGFGDGTTPLLLATRSGAVISLPGFLPTVTHIGLNEGTVEAWSQTLEEPYRAYHAYFRFLFNYAEHVLGSEEFRTGAFPTRLRARSVADLCVRDLRTLRSTAKRLKRMILDSTGGRPVPDDCYEQLISSVYAVFASYEREDIQRRVAGKNLPADCQTACLIQDCLPVLSSDDCSGVFLTRDPRDGGQGPIEFVHDFGEDLAAGRVKPGLRDRFRDLYPEQFDRLEEVRKVLERRYRNPNDIEFSIREHGVLYIVQNRRLLMVPMGEVITDFDFYRQGLISEGELVRRTRRIASQPLVNTYLREIDKKNAERIASGQPISGGVASGRLVCDESKIGDLGDDDIIFVTKSNVPREVRADSRITGYLSEEGGVTSHAALVSVGNIPCIVGVSWRRIGNKISVGEHGFGGQYVELEEGEYITLDANEGCVYRGWIPIQASPENDPKYREAESEIRKIMARINAYTLRPPSMNSDSSTE